jgi:DNA-binding CsgD family transcriptional regulator
MAKDLFPLLEAAYAPAASDEEWLSGVLYAARPLLDRSLGVAAFFYDWAAPPAHRVSTPLGAGLPRGALAALDAVNSQAPETLARALVDARPSCATLSARLGLGARIAEHPIVREHLAPLGVRDFFAVAAACPTGQGCVIGAPLPRAARVSPAEACRWTKLASHVAFGLRMQRRFPAEREEAIDADPSGTWRALVAGAFSIADYFDHDGRRYVVARRREPARRSAPSGRDEHSSVSALRVARVRRDMAIVRFDLRADSTRLSDAERAVALLVVDGHTNTEIGALRGTSARTVANQVAHILAKLGLRSRVELAARTLLA